MEVERKFLLKALPASLELYNKEEIEQGYLSVNPVVRVRRQGDAYYLTYKGGGMLAHEEYNLPLTKESYAHLLQKSDGYVITKTRYLIDVEELALWETHHQPRRRIHEDVGNGRVIELDVFHGDMEGLVLAEIEFASEEQANAFEMPECFLEDVTYDGRYHNSYMSRNGWKD
jgi:CYTH domain-containing protein